MKDKNYWLLKWKEQRLKNKIWELYPDLEMSWKEIFKYFDSHRFTSDVVNDLYKILYSGDE